MLSSNLNNRMIIMFFTPHSIVFSFLQKLHEKTKSTSQNDAHIILVMMLIPLCNSHQAFNVLLSYNYDKYLIRLIVQ